MHVITAVFNCECSNSCKIMLLFPVGLYHENVGRSKNNSANYQIYHSQIVKQKFLIFSYTQDDSSVIQGVKM